MPTATKQPVRFSTERLFLARFTGGGEFYSGIGTGDEVLVYVVSQVFTCGDGRVKAATRVSVQRDPEGEGGAWLSLYDSVAELSDVREVGGSVVGGRWVR